MIQLRVTVTMLKWIIYVQLHDLECVVLLIPQLLHCAIEELTACRTFEHVTVTFI